MSKDNKEIGIKFTHAFVDAVENKKVEALFQNKEFKAVTCLAFDGRDWVAALVTIKDGRISEIDVSNPDARQISEATGKIYFVDEFMEKEV